MAACLRPSRRSPGVSSGTSSAARSVAEGWSGASGRPPVQIRTGRRGPREITPVDRSRSHARPGGRWKRARSRPTGPTLWKARRAPRAGIGGDAFPRVHEVPQGGYVPKVSGEGAFFRTPGSGPGPAGRGSFRRAVWQLAMRRRKRLESLGGFPLFDRYRSRPKITRDQCRRTKTNAGLGIGAKTAAVFGFPASAVGRCRGRGRVQKARRQFQGRSWLPFELYALRGGDAAIGRRCIGRSVDRQPQQFRLSRRRRGRGLTIRRRPAPNPADRGRRPRQRSATEGGSSGARDRALVNGTNGRPEPIRDLGPPNSRFEGVSRQKQSRGRSIRRVGQSRRALTSRRSGESGSRCLEVAPGPPPPPRSRSRASLPAGPACFVRAYSWATTSP